MRKLDKTLKIIIMIILVFTSIIVSNPKSYAASASISCASSIETNKPLVISVTGTGVQWHLVLKVNGTVIAESSELDNYESNKSINFTGTYTPTSAGTLNVELSGSVTEHSDGSTITSFSSRTVTVTEPKPDPTPTPTPDPEPDLLLQLQEKMRLYQMKQITIKIILQIIIKRKRKAVTNI